MKLRISACKTALKKEQEKLKTLPTVRPCFLSLLKHMKHCSTLLLFLVALCTLVSAQGEANWWYFGNNAGVHFNPAPTAVTNGALNTVEGVASISDVNGNLLFYTDGLTVYNANHTTMTNGTGLLGNTSSTQSAVIVRKPGSSTLYYIFTADLPPSGSIAYSIVDMTLSGGLGAVTVKNTILYTGTTERICAVRHCNNTDVWIITHEWGSNQFKTFLLSAAGVNATAVNSSAGAVNNSSTANAIGYLKASPEGRRLAMAMRYTPAGSSASIVEMYDFDNTTGIVSNAVNMGGGYGLAYGIEFSPDGTLLYTNSSSPPVIYQYNLCAGTPAQIVASRVQVGTTASGFPGSLQLGPDKKIYMARYSSQYIGVINSPNTSGTGCNYVDNGVYLGGKTSSLGLPNFVSSYFSSYIPVISSTFNTTINCTVGNFSYNIPPPSCTGAGNVNSLVWDFGDPSSGAANTSTSTSPTHNFTAAGSYTVKLVINYNCFSDTGQTVVNVVTCGMAVALQGDTICAGNCTNLQASVSGNVGATTYTWTPNIGNGAGPYSVCPGTTTTYKVVVSDAAGNIDSATAMVQVNTLPVVTTSASNVSCNGLGDGSATANVTGTSPFTYNWSTAPAQSTQTATGLNGGNYNVTVSDPSGCSATASATVSEPALLVASISSLNDVSCNGANDGNATVTATGGNGSYTYLWNTTPQQTTQQATALAGGLYIVTVTDANSCTDTASVDIAEPTALTLSLTAVDVMCNGASTGSINSTANGGTTPYTYSWNSTPQQTTANAANLAAGNYTLALTDNNSCTISASATVNEPAAIVLTTTTTIATCGLTDGTATVNASGGVSPYIYNWNTTPAQNTSTATGLGAGVYMVTVTDNNACTAVDSAVVTSTSAVQASITSFSDVKCNGGSDGSATVTATNGSGTYNYNWSTLPAQTTATALGLAIGSYSVTVNDANNCSASASVTIGQPAALINNVSNSPSYCNLPNGSAWVNSSGGVTPYAYLWNDSQNTDTAINLNAGTYTVTITDANNCSASASTFVAGFIPPTLVVNNSTDVSCYGGANGTIDLGVSGGSAPPYQFSTDGLMFSPNNLMLNLSAGSYTFYVQDFNGCTDTVIATVSEPAALIFSPAQLQMPACFGGADGSITVSLSGGTPPYQYTWNTSPVQLSATALNISAGSYIVSATDANGCTATQTNFLTEPTALSLTLSPQPGVHIDLGNSVTLSGTASGGTMPYTYSWQPSTDLSCGSCPQPIAAPATTTDYTLVVTDSNQCSTSQSVEVIVDLPSVLFIPNAFSPNGDGNNDVFSVYTQNAVLLNFKIFNRWGELVYETNNLFDGWDGTYKGSIAPPAVYTYYIHVSFLDGSSRVSTGSVTLFR